MKRFPAARAGCGGGLLVSYCGLGIEVLELSVEERYPVLLPPSPGLDPKGGDMYNGDRVANASSPTAGRMRLQVSE